MTLRLNGDSSGFTEIKAADAAGDNSIKLPASNGSANQLLKNGGTAGELEYASNVVVDSSGKLGVGQATPTAKLHIGAETEPNLSNQALFVEGSKGAFAGYTGLPMNQLCVYDNTVSTAGSGGAIGFGANTGSTQRTWIAAINSARDSGSNDATNYAGSLQFHTRPPQSVPAERLRITSDGTVRLLYSPGIDFGGIQTNVAGMTSETLDSYEEGTFDAGFANHIPGNINYTRQAGFYVKVGKLVQCVGTFSFTTYTSFPAGYSTFTLPFAAESLDAEGDGFSQSWWAILSGGQVRQTAGGANCFLFGPLGQSGFSNIFTDGVSAGLANANFNTIFNGHQGDKTIRYHHIYRAA